MNPRPSTRSHDHHTATVAGLRLLRDLAGIGAAMRFGCKPCNYEIKKGYEIE
jgi:hypothetical protein